MLVLLAQVGPTHHPSGVPSPPWYSATAVATTQAAPKQKNPLKPTEKPFPEKPEHPQDLYKQWPM